MEMVDAQLAGDTGFEHKADVRHIRQRLFEQHRTGNTGTPVEARAAGAELHAAQQRAVFVIQAQLHLAAAKAESKAQWEEAKAMGKPSVREAMLQAERDAQIAEANERKAAAEARIEATKQ